MKAVVCTEFGGLETLEVQDLPVPEPAAGEVLIEVRAAGINFPDLLAIAGKYQFRSEPPFVPGVEAAGIVSALGEGVTSFSVGDEVFATSLSGAFAERFVAPAQSVVAKGRRMSFEQAAGFPTIYGTSYYALKQRARLDAGETVLVLGAAGGVGIAAVQLAKAMGARVIAAASNEEKLDFACAAGADDRINYSNADLKTAVRALTGGKGVDVVYDPVGGELAEPAFRATGWGGRYLVIGFASGTIPRMPLNLALLKGTSLVGVFWGSWLAQFPSESAENFRELVEMVDDGALEPKVTATYPLEQFAEAFTAIAERRTKGKVVLSIG